MNVRNFWVGAAALSLAATADIESAHACGGFFCGQTPVDQTAERILFAVGESSTTMAVQIQYGGDAADFAWVLPLAEVPDPQSLAVFPQRALTALDANTGPIFDMPQDSACYSYQYLPAPPNAGGSQDAGGVGGPPPEVTIHYEVEVGPYGAAVVESTDPQALVTWLRDNGYRVAPAMEPYISVYTSEGMKFLALKLLPEAGADDIEPLRFTLPGQTPSIPIRLTALASEPEMSLLVFVLGDQRFEGANWESVEIADSSIRWAFDYNFSFGIRTNWTSLVAKGIDQAGGRGWVTELAAPSVSYADSIRSQPFLQPEDEAAAQALLGLLDGHPYLTRLYARLSAEEMTFDPVFRRSASGDVSRNHQLERFVNGEDLCPMTDPGVEPKIDPCDFVTCGAGGECFVAEFIEDGAMVSKAGCACVPGATARTTKDPQGEAMVACQDLKMSFLNPGDRDSKGDVLPDPCPGFDCGRGHCEAVNLTPTCVCDKGSVAIGGLPSDGTRMTKCVAPRDAVPEEFYARRLPALPPELPGGREVEVPDAGISAEGGIAGSDAATSDGAPTVAGDGCGCRVETLRADISSRSTGLVLAGLLIGAGVVRRRPRGNVSARRCERG